MLAQTQTARKSRRNKAKLKRSTIAIYASTFVLLVAIIAIGYRSPGETAGVTANATSISASTAANTPQPQTSVDDVVATSVAADVAQTTNLPIAANVANLSTSAQISSEISQSTDASTISKPQIVQPTASSRTITTYTSVAGDTAQSVAAKYNLSATTIKWANNLTSDALNPGTNLQILPTNGIMYTVKSGDTVASIASKYQADASRITVYNDLDQTASLTTGAKLIVPDGVLPANEQPGYVAPVLRSTYRVAASTPSYTGYAFQGGSVGNRYAFGNCTWYAYERRAQLGRPVGSFWGNAATWAIAAEQSGYLVDHNPAAGAVFQMSGAQAGSYYGHVGIVESVNGDGSINVSEMNYAGNFDRVTYRTISAGQADLYNYIH